MSLEEMPELVAAESKLMTGSGHIIQFVKKKNWSDYIRVKLFT